MTSRSGITGYNRDAIASRTRGRGLRVVGGGSVPGPTDPEAFVVVVGTGQTIYAAVGPWSATKGIKRSTAVLTIPSASPTVGGTYTDGLSDGQLINPDGTTSLVWLAYCSLSPFACGNFGSIPKDVRISCYQALDLTYTGAVGGATTTVYVFGSP